MVGDQEFDTKQERRERKQQKKRDKIQKHGQGIAQLYLNAIVKRLKRLK